MNLGNGPVVFSDLKVATPFAAFASLVGLDGIFPVLVV